MKSKQTIAERLQKEVADVDGKLAVILLDAELKFPGLVLTQLGRKQSEQDAIYNNYFDPIIRAEYKLRPWKSVHQCLPIRGADIRAGDEADTVAEWITSRWQYDPARPRHRCAIVHDAGRGLHIHVQSHADTVRR